MSKTRGHVFKVRGVTFEGDVWGKLFFTGRVVGAWNTLPGVVVDTDVLFCRHINMQGLEGYALHAGRGCLV